MCVLYADDTYSLATDLEIEAAAYATVWRAAAKVLILDV